jgi:MFS family permease
MADRAELAKAGEANEARFAVLAFLCVSAMIAYVQRAALSVPATEIAGDLKFQDLARDMGYVQSAWYFAYALMQIPGGRIADRLGSRRALSIFSVLWSLATFGAAFAAGFWSLVALWALMGAAQAGAFPCAAKALGQIFPESQRARATGFLASGMMIGGAIAPVMTATFLQSIVPLSTQIGIDRWRLLLGIYAIPGVLWSVVFLATISPRNLPDGIAVARSRAAVPWAKLFTDRSLALLCGQQFFRAAGMVFFLTWFPTFLQKTRGVDLMASGILTTVAGIGGVIGSLSGGFFSDRLYQKTGNARLSRQGIAIAGMSACSLLIVASYFASDVRTSIALISVGAFCASFGGVSGYTVAISYGGTQVATVFSTMNMCGNFGAALFPVTAGKLVAVTGNWNLILFLFAGIMAIDAVCWALLNPRGTFSGDEA